MYNILLINKEKVASGKPNHRGWAASVLFKRLSAFALLVPAILLSVLVSVGQEKPIHPHPAPIPTKSETQQAYSKLKALAGNWEGPVTNIPAQPMMAGKIGQISLRLTSSGNALMHELTMNGMKDDPITMFYVNEDQFLLTHYCDAGNRPRMIGKLSPDGKTLDFDFIDITGPTKYGHMHHAKFTFIDDNHHTEEWTYMLPGDKPARALFDLQRKK